MAKENDTPIAERKVGLKKELDLWYSCTIIIGIVIGSGIFVSPKGVLQEVQSVGASLIIWVICGVVSLIGAFCYAELGTMIPKSGADYAYLKEGYGPLSAFLFVWSSFVCVIPCANAITALTFANYLFQPFFGGCVPPDSAKRLLAAICILFLTLINCWNVRWAARVQSIFTIVKLAALTVICLIGVVRLIQGRTEAFTNSFADSRIDGSAYAVAFYSGFYSYSGWNYLNMVTEEMKNPRRNLPLAIAISLPVVTVVYVFANVAYFTVLSPADLLASDAVAVSFGERVVPWFSYVFSLCVAASTFGGLNGCILTSSRLAYVGARDDLFPNFLAFINLKYNTPMPSLIACALISILCLFIGDVYLLINYATYCETIFIAGAVSTIIYLRVKQPNRPRPIQMPIVLPILFLIICAYVLIYPLITDASTVLGGLIIVLIGIPVYWLGVSWKSKPQQFTRFTRKTTILTQKLFVCVKPDFEEDEEYGSKLDVDAKNTDVKS